MNLLTLTQRRASARFFAAITIVSLLLSAFPAAFFVANATVTDPEGTLNTFETAYTNKQQNVRICHWDNDEQKFANDNQSVDISAAVKGTGHGGHANDIIPPFWYQFDDQSPQLYTGLNWNDDGKEIYNNGCAPITGSISGTKYNDINNDGKTDGDSGIENWTIRLYELGNPWKLVKEVTTDENGNYSFTDVPKGEYKVCELLPEGWTQTFVSNGITNESPNASEEGPECQTVKIDEQGEKNTKNFGNHYAETVPDEPVKPIFECYVDNGDETGTGYFGYLNQNDVEVNIAIGEENKVTGGPNGQDEGQPTTFAVGRTGYVDDAGVFKPENAAFSVEFPLNGNVVWTLTDPVGDTRTATAGTGGKECPKPVEPPRCENLLVNGSFEEPVVTNNSLWQKFTEAFTGWVTQKVSDNTDTTLEIHRGWSGNDAAYGEQYAELDGDHSTKISQTVDTIPGAVYELKWAFAPRHSIAAEQNQLSVLVNGVEKATEGPATGAAGLEVGDWTLSSYSFTADSDETTLTFSDAGPSNSFGTFLDDAQLCLVREPEPSVTIHTTKFVCTDEADLPNWGAGGDDITADTVADWLAANPDTSCEIVEGWEFEWAPKGVSAPQGYNSYIGYAGEGWTTFTGSVEVPASAFADKGHINLREVIPSTEYDTFAGGSKNNVSPEFYCGNDVLNYDNLERINKPVIGEEYYCVAWNVTEPKESDVTVCKYDEAQNPLSGWTLMLLGEEVDSLEVPAGNSAGVDSVSLTGGQSYVAIANGTWDNNRGPLNIVDAEYSTEDNWLTWMDGFTGFPTDILELFIGGESDPDSVWGAYNSSHRYAQSFVPGVDGPVNFSINDTYYGDNTGSLAVELYTGYAGITGDNGCVTFEDVPFGTYNVDEVMLDGWKNLSGLGELSVETTAVRHAVVNQDISEIPVATLVAEKVVCEAEEYLPNWNDDGEAPKITGATAADYVTASEGKCWLEEDWYFEWAAQGTSNPDNDLPYTALYGVAGGNWTTFGPTDGTGKAQVSLTEEDIDGDSYIWVREVLQEGYIPFTYGPGNTTNADNETAEFYCHTDGKNYDNYDRVDGIQVDKTYHCVAFNTEIEKPVEQCTLDIYSDTMTLVEETNELAVATYDGNDAWTANIPGATWIWATEQVENPESNETYTFVETFEVENPTEANLTVAYDNWLILTVNGTVIDDRTGVNGYQDYQKQTYNILSALKSGENRIEFEVTNQALNNSDYRNNPAGVLFHLTAKGDENSCERTTEPEPDDMYLIDGYKFEQGDDYFAFTADWEIELYDGEGEFVMGTSTDAEGYYYFYVPAGEYEVREVMKSGWEQVGIEDGLNYIETTEGPLACTFEVPVENDDYPLFNSISVFLQGEELNYSEYRCNFYNIRVNDDEDDEDDDSDDGDDEPRSYSSGTRISRPAPQVLGETVSQCEFLKEHMQMGAENNPFEVMKLQMFLKMVMGYDQPVTGFFGAVTDANVKRFQEQYASEVLDPWYFKGIVPHYKPTGFVYKLTKWKINDIVCPGWDPYPSFEGESLAHDVAIHAGPLAD